MEPIIEPVSRSLLLAELTPERKVRNTNKASNEIYIFDAAECPSLLREIGRLREVAFRSAGGGTGLAVDIDEEDLAGDGSPAAANGPPPGGGCHGDSGAHGYAHGGHGCGGAPPLPPDPPR